MAGVAAAIWGIWWIPIRYLETLGLHGAWGGMAMSAGACALAVIWMVARRQSLRLDARAMIGAALVGVAISTYSTALNHTDVVRAVLLFYLAPAWSKLIEWRFLKLPWHWVSTLTVAAALLGAFLTLGGKVGGGALNFGDILAIICGVAWAAGATLVFTGGKPSAVSLTAVTTFFAVLVAVPFAFFDGGGVGGGALALGVGLGAAYVFPIMVMTLWAAQRLSPATITFLLSAEILTGVISGAVLLDEPFGLMQILGAGLIVFAATSEILTGLRRAG